MSAYALFFRDTQAAIKGQNPNATFGDVSKIVASMWDSLGEEQKQVNWCRIFSQDIIILGKKSSYLCSEWTMLLGDVELYLYRATQSFELAEDLSYKNYFL